MVKEHYTSEQGIKKWFLWVWKILKNIETLDFDS
jgi:hypothetical protein